jgi:hypothetical protein
MANSTITSDNTVHKGVKIYDRPPSRPLWAFPVALLLMALLWYVIAHISTGATSQKGTARSFSGNTPVSSPPAGQTSRATNP